MCWWNKSTHQSSLRKEWRLCFR